MVFRWFLDLDKELIEEEICTRLDGCPIVKGVCVDCLTVKNYVGVTHRRSKKKD